MKKIILIFTLFLISFSLYARTSFSYDGEFGIKYNFSKVKQTFQEKTVYSKFNLLGFDESFSFGLAATDDVIISLGALFSQDAFSGSYRYLKLSQRLFILGKFDLKFYIAQKFLLRATFLFGGLFFYKEANYTMAIGARLGFGYVVFENKEKSIRVIPSVSASYLRTSFSDDFSVGLYITLERRAK